MDIALLALYAHDALAINAGGIALHIFYAHEVQALFYRDIELPTILAQEALAKIVWS